MYLRGVRSRRQWASRRLGRLALAGSVVCLMAGAKAATTSGPMLVTATVTGACIVGASALAFPSATSAAIAVGNIDATGNVTVNCTTGSHYTVKLGAGTGTGATMASRKMSSGTQLLSYSAYTTAARTTVWGDGTAASTTVTGIGNGANQSIAAYGRIFSGQVVPAATYSDTVEVTVSY